jgi:hypothetical protein
MITALKKSRVAVKTSRWMDTLRNPTVLRGGLVIFMASTGFIPRQFTQADKNFQPPVRKCLAFNGLASCAKVDETTMPCM